MDPVTAAGSRSGGELAVQHRDPFSHPDDAVTGGTVARRERTGGAIRAPGRADIFMGTGEGAETLAGTQKAEGRLYYFFVKPEFVEEWLSRRP